VLAGRRRVRRRSSESEVSRIELGRVALRARDISDLLTLYGIAGAAEREAFLELVEQANRRPNGEAGTARTSMQS
jgi:hypothetical protein